MAAPSRFFVHAEFTISHPGANDPENLPKTSTERQEEGVKMTYTWKTQEDDVQAWDSASNRSGVSDNVSRPSPTATRPFPDVRGGPGFQRGNMLFTSTPPSKSSSAASEVSRRFVQDSGYGSDLLSPTGGRGKCRSTCNITLSSSRSCPSQRTQSLRCQTPTSTRSASSFYGCGDPWCHHQRPFDDVRFSPLLEEDTCITGSRKPSRASTFTAADANIKKDVSVQTFEMVDKCTSPFMRTDSFRYLAEMNDYNRSPQPYSTRRKAFATSGGARKQFGTLGKPATESVSSLTPDSLENYKPSKKLTRSPGLKRLPAIDRTLKEISPASDSKSTSDSQKKPRTVHIDVYCTGTELESSSSEESSDSKTASTPQTVFESDKVRVTHKKASEEELPFNLRKKFNSQETASKSIKPEAQPPQNDSDNDDTISTAYPSKLSSYSTIRDFSESVSSVPWTNYSMSSFTLPDENDSVCNTSWKDTTCSDLDSLLHSKSSIDHTESLDFVPRRLYEKNASIDETPEYERKDLLETPSVDSLQPSDSFEYANSEDRLRIKRMEEMWKSKHWKSPQTLLQQQKKMQEYMEKKIQDKKAWKEKSKDSSDESDTSEKGWAIVKGSSKENKTTIAIDKTKQKQEAFKTNKTKEDQGSLSDSSPTRRSPSGQVSKQQQRFSLDPNLRSPFSITPGIYTEPRKIASKFGSIVNFLKKPGHHVGPARNPDCTCDHCQSYWDKVGRNRTRSMGDAPMNVMVNWKEFRNKQAE